MWASISVAYDHVAALKAPTSEFGQGVAMTAALKRNDVVKAHIVFNAAFIRPLENEKHEYWRYAAAGTGIRAFDLT